MRDDGILQITYVGDMGEEETGAFLKDNMRFLEAATEAEPLHMLADTSQGGKFCAAYRKALAGLMNDPRTGKVATVGATRYNQVLGGFLLKATGRDNIRFFKSAEEGLAWLKAES